MLIVITVLHVIMCVLLIGIVLLQTGKGANMGAAFGGGSNTIFGGAGPANFLNKITTVAAIVFMLTSFTLALLSTRGDSSSKVLDVTPAEQPQPASETAAPVTEEAEETEETGTETTTAPADEASQESTTVEEDAPAAADSQEAEQPSE